MDVSFFERFLLLTFIHLASSNPEIEEDEILQYPWIGLQGGLESSLERPTYNRLHIRREHCECPCNMGTPVPLVTEATVPVITIVGTSVIDVPCSYAGSTITGASLQFSGSDTGNFVVKQTVVDSSSGDYNKGYVYPTLTGQILRGSIGPVADTTQTIAFTIANAPAWAFSQPVNLTFCFRSCAFQIAGPSSFIYCQNQVSGTPFSGLAYTITNLPPNVPVIWDAPPPEGSGASLASQTASSFLSIPQNSPAVLGSTHAAAPGSGPDTKVYISSYSNPVINPGIGTYGPSTTSACAAPGECQTILLSAVPQYQAQTVFTMGTKKVIACASLDVNCSSTNVSFP